MECPACGSEKGAHNCKPRKGVIAHGQEEGRQVLNGATPACPGGVDAPPGLTPADITPDRINRIWASVMVREYLTEVLVRLRHAELRRVDVTGACVKVVISRGVLAAEWSATMDDPEVCARAARDVVAALERLKEEAPLP